MSFTPWWPGGTPACAVFFPGLEANKTAPRPSKYRNPGPRRNGAASDVAPYLAGPHHVEFGRDRLATLKAPLGRASQPRGRGGYPRRDPGDISDRRPAAIAFHGRGRARLGVRGADPMAERLGSDVGGQSQTQSAAAQAPEAAQASPHGRIIDAAATTRSTADRRPGGARRGSGRASELPAGGRKRPPRRALQFGSGVGGGPSIHGRRPPKCGGASPVGPIGGQCRPGLEWPLDPLWDRRRSGPSTRRDHPRDRKRTANLPVPGQHRTGSGSRHPRGRHDGDRRGVRAMAVGGPPQALAAAQIWLRRLRPDTPPHRKERRGRQKDRAAIRRLF